MGGWSWCARFRSRAVDGHCGRLMVVLGSCVVCCVLTVFVGVRMRGRSLVVIGGDRCGWWSACVVVERWWSGPVVVVRRLSMVVVRRKEAMSHIVTMASRLNIRVRSHVNDLTCNDLT